MVTPPLLTAGFLQLPPPLVLEDLLGALLGGQWWANFLDDVAAAIKDTVGTPSASFGKRIATDPAPAAGVLATVELPRCQRP